MDASVSKTLQYLQAKLKHELFVLPVEQFKNSKESGYGIRALIGGTKSAFRLNWHGQPKAMDSVTSIDVWDGTSHDPVANIHIGGKTEQIMKALPEIVELIKHPMIGEQDTIVTEGREFSQLPLMEAAKKWTPETITDTSIEWIKRNATKVGKAALASQIGYANAGVLDIIKDMYPDSFKLNGKSLELVGEPAFDRNAIIKELSNRSINVAVTSGGKGETYGETEAEKAVASEEPKVSFKKQQQHIYKLTQALAKGAFNALVLAGVGGVGKTYQVEKALADLGLKDGEGYFKQTGATSAIGLYATLYNNREGIVLLDDCDSALADQDARNIIKAATDTKKERKMSWGKRSSMMYDPQAEEVDEEEDGVDKFPRYFNFEGQIIVISNLSPDKLDPDGAIRSRAMMLNIAPTREEMFDMMKDILPNIEVAGGMSLERRQEVMNVVMDSQRKDTSLRKLVRALNIAASGIEGWQELVTLYA